MLRIAGSLVVLVSCTAERGPPPPTAAAPKAEPASPMRDDWCIHKLSDQDGDLVFVTINRGYRTYSKRTDFPYFLHINVSTVGQNPNGHPTTDEGAILNQVEDAITATLRDATPVLFLGRATTRGFRELMYVVRDPDRTNAVLTQIAATPQRRSWEFRVVEDHAWTHVQPLLDDDSACL